MDMAGSLAFIGITLAVLVIGIGAGAVQRARDNRSARTFKR